MKGYKSHTEMTVEEMVTDEPGLGFLGCLTPVSYSWGTIRERQSHRQVGVGS